MSDPTDDDARQRRRLELLRSGQREHRAEMRRLDLLYVRAVTSGLTEVERLELDGLDYAARDRAAEPPVPFHRTGEAGPLPFTAMAERREQSRREHSARLARAARERGVAERLAAASGRAWPV
jgi:hypothetical protein